MIDSIRRFFTRTMQPAAPDPDAAGADEEADRRRLHVSACALLLELAHADDEFTERERAQVESAVRRHLGVDEKEAQELIALADEERRGAIDLYQFTSMIREHYDIGQKAVLAEIMWGVVLADGEIHKDEDYLLRKVANLLDVQPGFLSHARKRATGVRPPG
jgi:uncharacterized tellurite resistance protein B-like protein